MSLGLLFFFYRVIRVGSSTPGGPGSAALANVCATTITTIPSYYLNRAWVWGKSGKSHLWTEVVPFWIIAFVSLVLSTGAVWLAAHFANQSSLSKDAKTLLVELANLFTYGVLWIVKFIIFNKILFKTDPPPPVVSHEEIAFGDQSGESADALAAAPSNTGPS
jgi:putative flippase GtrA